VEKLLENRYIRSFLKLLEKNSYVQISDESLRIQASVSNKIKLYNDGKNGFDAIQLNKENNKIVCVLKNNTSKSDQNLLSEIEILLDLKEIFSDMQIGETSVSKKRKAIAKALQEETKTFVDIACADILYYPDKVTIVEIDSLEIYNEKYNSNIAIKKILEKRTIYFRGQSNINWEIQPSIFRGNWITHEKDFIEEMIIRNPSDFDNCRTTIEKLTKMQHYNAPTRLLDLTKNRLIALYFACEKAIEETGKPHGEVVMFSDDPSDNPAHTYYYDGDTVSMIANIAMMDTSFDPSKDMGKLSYQIKQDKPNFDEVWGVEYLQKCVITHVKLDNKRIMNQQGLFLLVGMGKDRKHPADIAPYLLKEASDKKVVFIVPYKYKAKILNELNQININKGFIYPEIDDVADYLKKEVFKQ